MSPKFRIQNSVQRSTRKVVENRVETSGYEYDQIRIQLQGKKLSRPIPKPERRDRILLHIHCRPHVLQYPSLCTLYMGSDCRLLWPSSFLKGGISVGRDY